MTSNWHRWCHEVASLATSGCQACDKTFLRAIYEVDRRLASTNPTSTTQIRDASRGDTGGQFLNAERNLLQSRGWTFDPSPNMWISP